MTVTVKVGGKIFSRWTSVRITRGLKRCVSDCELGAVGEFLPAILPFDPVTVYDGDDLLLTGYVVATQYGVSAADTRTTVHVQSKTQDLDDCMILGVFGTNQFNGYKLDALARVVAKQFGIDVVIGPGVDVGDPFPDATFEHETAFAYLERLARQRGVLLTDDANGNLVLATAGTTRAPGPLVMGEGGNLYEAEGLLNGKGRFSQYTITSQAGIAQTGTDVQVGAAAIARDGGVPRFRPWAGMAESALVLADAQVRVDWEAAHRSGEAVNATLSVPEWRFGDPTSGPLWQANQVVACKVPRLALNDDFLIAEVTYLYDEAGKRTGLAVAPPSAFTPEPRATLAKSGANSVWGGIGRVVP